MRNLLELAIFKATIWHRGQVDKQGKPYILHPLAVMFRLQNEPEPVQIAAVLHDVVEDCGVPIATIKEFFGAEVASIVNVLTRYRGVEYEDYIRSIKVHPVANRIKLADLAENLREDRPIDDALGARYVKAVAVLTGMLSLVYEDVVVASGQD